LPSQSRFDATSKALITNHRGLGDVDTCLETPPQNVIQHQVVFDDRLPHGVGRIDGPTDPLEGRFALHGRLQVAGPTFAGTLTEQQIGAIVSAAWSDFIKAAAARVRLYHGPVVVRLEINASGQVDGCTLLMDRVIATDVADVGWPKLVAELVARLKQCRFANGDGPTVVIQPFLLGEPFTRPQR
jgi:hypothetical protein